MEHRTASPSLWISLLPAGFLLTCLITNVALFGEDASGGPNQVALLLAAMVAGGIGRFVLKMNYRELEGRAIKSIVLAMEAVIILLIVGALIALWILSGVVPAMIYYGVQLLNPSVFLLVSCLVCSVVSLAIGSSWSTMGTVGVALLGIGRALGFPDPLVAGAIISGAYFGDKMSPLSDTTNLAPAVAGSELFTHVRHMFYTTIPTYAITLIIFTTIGLFYDPGEYSPAMVQDIVGTLGSEFNIHWYLLLIPTLVIAMAACRVSAIPSLVIGALLGAATALVFQGKQMIGADGVFTLTGAYEKLLDAAYNGLTMDTGSQAVDALLSRGGMVNMTNTVTLILMAMLLGGVMEATGMLQRIAQAILRLAHGAGSLIITTIASCIVFNITASEQYLAIVMPGRMFRNAYRQYGLDPRNLSRALEDGGTVTSVLVPWNTCGAFASGVLGVATLSYAPFCLFNLIGPVVAMTMAAVGIGIKRLPDGEAQSGSSAPESSLLEAGEDIH